MEERGNPEGIRSRSLKRGIKIGGEGNDGISFLPPLPMPQMDLESKKPAPPPLYIVGRRMGAQDEVLAQPSPSPKYSSSLAVLGEALQDCHAPPPPPRRRAAAGWSLPQPLPLSLLDQGMGDVTGLYVC